MTEVTHAYGFRGRTLLDRSGDKIGKIDDVYEHEQAGQTGWALVTTGLFGTKKTFVPLRGAHPVGEDVRVPVDRWLVKDAPRVDVDGDAELSESEERRLFEHYDVAYTTDGGDVSGPTTDEAMTRSEEELRVASERREVGRVRLRKYVVTENEQRTVPVRLDTEERTDQQTTSETLRKERVETDGDARS
jgi:Domain of unknown function (DUF2382)/PRC-barrel domain